MNKFPVHDDDELRLILDTINCFVDRYVLIDGLRDCEAAQAKVIVRETLLGVAGDGMQILASSGYASDNDMQRIWRDARLYMFGEGSNDIQRYIIAKELGL